MHTSSILDVRPTIGNTMLVAAFPGTGKSHYVNYGEGSGYMPQGFATDSDSSKFDKANFPANYIEHIKQKISEGYARVFISSHKDVRNALVENDLPFSAVSVLHYKYYQSEQEVASFIENNDAIQCVVGKAYLPFGQAQNPTLDQYADGVDTMAFLYANY